MADDGGNSQPGCCGGIWRWLSPRRSSPGTSHGVHVLRRPYSNPTNTNATYLYPVSQMCVVNNNKSEVRSAVWKLPLEVYATDDELRTWSVHDLREELRLAPRRAPRCLGGHEDAPLPPLDKQELVAAVVHARGGEGGRSCSVCCEDFVSEDTLRVLQCGHRFHLECVDRWLLGHDAGDIGCPMCKAPLLSRRGT
mmetsp:Transcript_16563/g.35539  ORF Transcript_16563/g.35539 Transcript_16563/m.35539 type:complete len:195 (-) Transcript_16563:710-1294(-)